MAKLLVRDTRIVSTSPGEPKETVDLRVHDNRIVDIAPAGSLSVDSHERLVEADGRWVIPGLWDQHVHMTTWAESVDRLNLSGTHSPADVLSRVSQALDALNTAGVDISQALIGTGYRASQWDAPASVAALDSISGGRPVVLIAGDGHNGWLNSAALRAFGLDARETLLDEYEWFPIFARLSELPQAGRSKHEQLRSAIDDASAKGIVGITDFEFDSPWKYWAQRMGDGLTGLRVRAGFYEEELEAVLDSRLHSGDVLGDTAVLGPLKIISDGSLGTLTAYCCEPYAMDPKFPNGKQNVTPEHMRELLQQAYSAGLEVALHAIGDRAVSDAITAFELSGAAGSIEHAQLMCRADIKRMAALGLRASVQPAHLLDDLEVMMKLWSDRADRCFLFHSMAEAGIELALGSDAPVAPLDPWLAIDAAVNRAAAGSEPWVPEERISRCLALFSSTNGQGPIAVGSIGDFVLLDHDPLTTRGSDVRVAATALGGELTYDAIT